MRAALRAACATRPALGATARALSNTSGVRRPGGKGSGFWSKWNAVSQQQFEQEVSLDGDKRSERRRSPLRHVSDDANRLSPRDDYDDLEFALEDSFEVANPRDRKPLRSVDEANAMRDALLDDDAVSARRRAELLGMLDELGPTSFAPPPAYPSFADEKKKLKREQADLFSGPAELAAMSLGMVPGFIDATMLRDSGALPPGGYFAHVLHTRRVSKTTGAGKTGSISILAVVGNGEGSAGFGLGKDGDPTAALVKACRAAKKNMLHIERFDNRTIFHDMEDKWARCKVVILLRRAGSGTRCNWLMWKVLSAFGLRDMSVKVHGSRNNISQTRAIFNALQRMRTAQDIADARQVRVLDMTPRSASGQAGYRPD